MRKTKIDDVTPAKPVLSEQKLALSVAEWVEGAGVQNEKAGFPLEFIPHTMRGGNDKYYFRNRN